MLRMSVMLWKGSEGAALGGLRQWNYDLDGAIHRCHLGGEKLLLQWLMRAIGFNWFAQRGFSNVMPSSRRKRSEVAIFKSHFIVEQSQGLKRRPWRQCGWILRSQQFCSVDNQLALLTFLKTAWMPKFRSEFKLSTQSTGWKTIQNRFVLYKPLA